MLKVGSYYGQFNQWNWEEWGWQTYCDLLWYVKAGCNKPRFELLAPANLNVGGRLVAVEKLSKNVVSIRAMGGHSQLSVDPVQMGRVKITHEMFPQLYHVTYWANIDSIYDIGLRPGGLDKKKHGIQEVFFSCESQAGWNLDDNDRYYAACNNSQSNPTTLPARVGLPIQKGRFDPLRRHQASRGMRSRILAKRFICDSSKQTYTTELFYLLTSKT